MLGWVILFFILAIVAAHFGFGGIAALSADMGQLLLVIFFVLLLVSIICGGISRASRGRLP